MGARRRARPLANGISDTRRRTSAPAEEQPHRQSSQRKQARGVQKGTPLRTPAARVRGRRCDCADCAGVVPYETASGARVSVHLSREEQHNHHLMARVTPRRKAKARVSGRAPARHRAAVMSSAAQKQAAGLERLKHLEEKLALAPASSHQRLTLVEAVRIEANSFRKSLDTEQATAAYGAKPGPPSVHRQASGRAIALRGRSAPRH
jgi:hypothetical protein